MRRMECTCDKCGKIEFTEYNKATPDGWRSLYYRTDSYGYGNFDKQLCPECCNVLGIKTTSDNVVEEKSLAERLVDILTEIAQSNVG